jgi:hypothetical protein
MDIDKEKAIMWQKKLLLWTGMSVFAAALGFTTVASAQVNLPVQAEVLQALTVTPGDDLNFGSFVAGTGGTIVVNADGITPAVTTGTVVPFGNDARGTVTVTGLPGTPVQVTVALVTDPTEAGGTTMSLSALTCGDDGGTVGLPDTPCSFNMPGVGGVPVDQLVGIGGTLTAAAAQTPATYTGTISVTAAFSPGP